MRSKKQLWKICEEIYQKMYKEAEPPLDFKKAVEEGYTAKNMWFMNHYLNSRRQDEIFNEITKKHKCTNIERLSISTEIWLGASPTGIKK